MAREIYKTVPLDDQLIPEVLRGSNFTNETSAHQFIITCTKNNEPVRLTGSVRGRFIAADNTSFLIDGSIASGNAVVTLHQDCYHAPGRFQFVIFNTNGTENVAIYAAVGEVRRSDTNDLYITGEPLPDIDELLDAMGDLRDIIRDYDDIVLVQSEQPTSATNKIWIQPQADEYQVPTLQEHEDLAEEVADLKSALTPSAFVPTGEAYPSNKVSINRLITVDGVENNLNGRACTAYINGSRIGKAVSVNSSGYLFRLYYFTTNTQSGFDHYDETYYPCDGSIVAIPNQSYLYRINFYHDPVDSVAFTEEEGTSLAGALTLYDSASAKVQELDSHIAQEVETIGARIDNEVQGIDSRIDEKAIAIPVTFASRLSPIGYKGQTGNVGDTWKHTEHIDISKYVMLTYTNVQHNNSSTTVGMSFYDTNGTWLAGWKATIADAYGYVLKSIPVPNNASYAVFSAYQDTATYGDFELYGILRTSDYIAPQWQGKKWYAYGTSLTSTVLGQYANVVAEKLGLILNNKGISGGGIVKDGGAIKTAVMDLTDGKLEADLITLEVGANDKDAQLGTPLSTDTTTFCGALNACIRFLQENTTAQIVVMSSTPAVSYKSAPVDPSFVYPGGFTALEQVQATENVCKANGVYYIPTNEGLGMGWARIKNSMYVKDNIHHTETGGLNLAMGIISRLKDIPLWYSDVVAVT